MFGDYNNIADPRASASVHRFEYSIRNSVARGRRACVCVCVNTREEN